MAKYNLGCGTNFKGGFVNVDIVEQEGENFVKCDITKYEIPDGTAEYILIDNTLEHLSFDDACELLKKCYKALTKDGELVILVPDFEYFSKLAVTLLPYDLLRTGYYTCNIVGIAKTFEDCHKSFYTDDILLWILTRMAGFNYINHKKINHEKHGGQHLFFTAKRGS